ncbi:MAG: pyridoxal phosphate-dependent decarboxylase family protein [Thermoanaerobaculia bacterium]
MNDDRELFDISRSLALEFRKSLATRPVHATANLAQLRAALRLRLPEAGEPPAEVLEKFAAAMEPGIIGSAGPRYFGFVIGGSYPLATATDWLVSAWDQNTGTYSVSPANAVAEEAVAEWVLELLHLPSTASVGFVTGGQMANTSALAAARHGVLRRAGWDVEERGLHGGPRVRIIATAETHATIIVALRYLGFGSGSLVSVPTDSQGRMITKDLKTALRDVEGPVIVCAQAGNVNTGSFDPIGDIVDLAHAHNAWVHVDGAFGLWAAASEKYRHLLAGFERADSWATDAHKWLNVPYDCGIVICADAAAHRAAHNIQASYLVQSTGAERDPFDYTPEFSRRGRALPLYTTLRALGRRGVEELVDRCCAHAALFRDLLKEEPGVRILADVVLNQVLVRFRDDDAITRATIEGVQQDGICWLSGTTWHGIAAMRISVSNWSTTEEDVRMSAEAILSAYRRVATAKTLSS